LLVQRHRLGRRVWALVALFVHLEARFDRGGFAFGLMAAAHFAVNAALHPTRHRLGAVRLVLVLGCIGSIKTIRG
jgi:hypothetical protein